MGNIFDRFRRQGPVRHTSNSRIRDSIPDPGGVRIAAVRDFQINDTNWQTLLQGLFNLLLASRDNETRLETPGLTPGQPSNGSVRLPTPQRFEIAPRNPRPFPAIEEGSLSAYLTGPDIWMTDEWMRSFVLSLKERGEDMLTVTRGSRHFCLLHLAARMNFPVATVEILHSNVRALNMPDDKGNTPLMEAASFASLETLYLLLRAGADVNLQNHRGETVTHLCVSKPDCYHRKRETALSLLLGHRRAPINAQDLEGNTPLHSATNSHGLSERIIILLLHRGANCTIRNSRGETPLYNYLKCLSHWSDIFQLIVHVPGTLSFHNRAGLKALHAMTPKYQSMIMAMGQGPPSVINTEGLQIIRLEFMRSNPLSLQEIAVEAVRRYVGLQNILAANSDWQNIPLPSQLKKILVDSQLRRALKLA